MGWDGAGNFSLLHDWTDDRDAAVKIDASRHDAQDEVLRVGVEASLQKNGENAATGNISMGGNKITSLGDATAAADATPASQIQAGGLLYAADTGSADTYAIAMTPTETAYATGQIFHFKAANDNTGASTLNVDTIGAKNIKTQVGGDPTAGMIDATGITSVIYDGTSFILIGSATPFFRTLEDDISAAVIRTTLGLGTLALESSPWHPKGLDLSLDSVTPDEDLNVTAGSVRDATDAHDMVLASEITKQNTGTWVVGDDQGGLDTGTVDASELYAVWLIKRSDTSVVDVLFSLSFTSPTMPTNYDFKRLIGAVVTDSTSDFVVFTQSGDYFRYTGDVIADLSDTIADDVFETTALSVPPNCLAHIYGSVAYSAAQVGGRLTIKTTGSADAIATNENFLDVNHTTAETNALTAEGMMLVDGSSQVDYTANLPGAGTATMQIKTMGFTMMTRSNP